MARFRVADTFRIPARSFFCIAGDIVDGKIRQGMCVILPDGSGFEAAIPIAAIDIGIMVNMQRYVALCLTYDDEQQRQAWEQLDLQNIELSVIDVLAN